MPIVTFSQLKSYFESGDYPKSSEYVDFIDTVQGLYSDVQELELNLSISDSQPNSSQTFIWYDTSNSDLKFYNGNSWVSLKNIDFSDAYDYTDFKIGALLNSAPTTLDTLNELAAALGDDPDFATTVLNRIGQIENDVSGLESNKADASELQDLEQVVDGQVSVYQPYFLIDEVNSTLLRSSISIDYGSASFSYGGYYGQYYRRNITINDISILSDLAVDDIIFFTRAPDSDEHIKNNSKFFGLLWKIRSMTNDGSSVQMVIEPAIYQEILYALQNIGDDHHTPGSTLHLHKVNSLDPVIIYKQNIANLAGTTGNIQDQIDGKASTGKAIAMAMVFG